MNLTIERFKSAHRESYSQALQEIRNGRKESHWIWYIFPQIEGLGRSITSLYYAIQNRAEAEEYWADPELAAHMREILQALLQAEGTAWEIMGPDAIKLRSSMTLFLAVTGEPIFRQVLDRFFEGVQDSRTLEILERKK